MGSPLSSFLAEAVIQDLETRTIADNKDITFWKRYVDDVFAIVKTEKLNNTLQTINTTTDNIRFTKEEGKDNQLPFLDVLLSKTNGGTLTTQVYRKNTQTDQVLNYHSTKSPASVPYTIALKLTATQSKAKKKSANTSTTCSSKTTTPSISLANTATQRRNN